VRVTPATHPTTRCTTPQHTSTNNTLHAPRATPRSLGRQARAQPRQQQRHSPRRVRGGHAGAVHELPPLRGQGKTREQQRRMDMWQEMAAWRVSAWHGRIQLRGTQRARPVSSWPSRGLAFVGPPSLALAQPSLGASPSRPLLPPTPTQPGLSPHLLRPCGHGRNGASGCRDGHPKRPVRRGPAAAPRVLCGTHAHAGAHIHTMIGLVGGGGDSCRALSSASVQMSLLVATCTQATTCSPSGGGANTEWPAAASEGDTKAPMPSSAEHVPPGREGAWVTAARGTWQ
jgi:hypothetical protein